MNNINRRDFIKASGASLAGLSLLGFSTPAQGDSYETPYAQLRSVSLIDNGKALVNPMMGWTFHFYSNNIDHYGSRMEPSDTLDDFPGLSTIYLRCPWSFIELEEGKFNWELLDTPAQRWIDKALKTAFRVTTYESWMKYATPEWVRKAGAAGRDITFRSGSNVLWQPDFCDPVFLQKLESFLAAFAERYDGNPNVAFVDIGSLGVWGEGHSLGESNRCTVEEGQKRHIDLHCKYLKKTLLCINDDYVGNVHKERKRFTISDYAFSKGVTLRDDSIMVQPPPDSWYNAGMAELFWPTLPVILETEHYGYSKRRNAFNEELMLRSIEEYHASYTSIHWWPRIFMEENLETIHKVNLRLGYRIQLREVSWPDEVRLGESFRVSASLANVGVAPCYPGGHPCFTLKDTRGGIVAVLVGSSANVKDLKVAKPGEAPVHRFDFEFAVSPEFRDPLNVFFRTFNPGSYDLFFSVGASDGTPQIELPHHGGDGKKRYKIGQIRILDRT
jgi:hypothetical protein